MQSAFVVVRRTHKADCGRNSQVKSSASILSSLDPRIPAREVPMAILSAVLKVKAGRGMVWGIASQGKAS